MVRTRSQTATKMKEVESSTTSQSKKKKKSVFRKVVTKLTDKLPRRRLRNSSSRAKPKKREYPHFASDDQKDEHTSVRVVSPARDVAPVQRVFFSPKPDEKEEMKGGGDASTVSSLSSMSAFQISPKTSLLSKHLLSPVVVVKDDERDSALVVSTTSDEEEKDEEDRVEHTASPILYPPAPLRDQESTLAMQITDDEGQNDTLTWNQMPDLDDEDESFLATAVSFPLQSQEGNTQPTQAETSIGNTQDKHDPSIYLSEKGVESSDPQEDDKENTPKVVAPSPKKNLLQPTRTQQEQELYGDFHIDDPVRINRGLYKGRSGTITALCPKTIRVILEPVPTDDAPKSKTFKVDMLEHNDNSKIDNFFTKPLVKKTPPSKSVPTLMELDATPTENKTAVQLQKDNDSDATIKDAESPNLGSTEPLQSPSSSSAETAVSNMGLKVGDRVRITGGRYAKRIGRLMKLNRVMHIVVLDGFEAFKPDKKINKKFIRCINDEDADVAETPLLEPISARRTTSKGKGTSTRTTRTSKARDPPSKVSTHSNHIARTANNPVENVALVPRKTQVKRFNKRRIVSFRMSSEPAQPTCCLDPFIPKENQDRVECSLKGFEVDEGFETIAEDDNGNQFELLGRRIEDDKGGMMFQRAKYTEIIYADTQGQGLQETLEKIANFADLSARKTVVRLELLLSEGEGEYKQPLAFDPQCIEEIPDAGHEGCGFICEDYLKEILGPKRKALCSRTSAIQVRIVAPDYGLFKGMLFKKKMNANEGKLQLPLSMRKVGASVHPDRNKHVGVLVIKGVFPSKSNLPAYKLIHPGLQPPRSFRPNQLKRMFLDLWHELGVSRESIGTYIRKCESKESLQHGWLVGVSDPTNSLPPGSVYVPGLSDANIQPDRIFITRSPAVEPEDGRMVELITTKPRGMSRASWSFLERFEFGVVVFANPKPGMKSTPSQISGGDLDGDLYLLCWNDEILSQLSTTPLNTDMPISTADEPKVIHSNPDWLADAQRLMIDFENVTLIDHFVGAMYKQGEKAREELHGLKKEDAKHFFAAYKVALDMEKHGGMARLPQRLVPYVDKRFIGKLVEASPSLE